MKSKLRGSPLRLLDVDDLIVMKLFLEGTKAKEISDVLGLSPPAVSHRFRKYTNLFDDKGPFFLKVKNQRVLTEAGEEMCKKASKALAVLIEEQVPDY